MYTFIIYLSFQFLFLFVLIYLNHAKWNLKFSNLKIAGLCSLLFYLSIIIFVIFTTYYLRNQLDSFDLDGNGFFTSEERNPSQQLAMKNVSHATARNLAPITGIVFSFIYFILICPIIYIINKRFFRTNL